MRKFAVVLLAALAAAILTLAACSGENDENTASNQAIWSYSSGTGSDYSASLAEQSGSVGGGAGEIETEKSTFERLSESSDVIIKEKFDVATFHPLYESDAEPGKWTARTKKGLYQNFSVKNGQGSPATNYVKVDGGVADIVDESGGGTKLIVDLGDEDISSGAIEGCFEINFVDIGIGWTFLQFFGTDGAKTCSEIVGMRVTSEDNGKFTAGIRLDGSADVTDSEFSFGQGKTYLIEFSFNLEYGSFSISATEAGDADGTVRISKSHAITSLMGFLLTSSDTDRRRASIDNLAVARVSAVEPFAAEITAFSEGMKIYTDDKAILSEVDDLVETCVQALNSPDGKTLREIVDGYKLTITELFTTSVPDFTMMNTIDDYVDQLMADTPSYIPAWSKEGFKNRWNYIDGVFLEALVQLYERTKDVGYRDFFINFINYYIYPAGQYASNGCKFRSPETASFGTSSAYNKGELDSVCESRILFDAYNYTGDERYLEAIEYTFKTLNESVPKAADTVCFSHKSSYADQIWLDGFYMYAPFYARYALLKGDNGLIDGLVAQYKVVYDNMKDETTGLYYHGYDPTKKQDWADKTTGRSKSVWLRAYGWLTASLVDVLGYIPAGENKEFLKKMLSGALESILVYRDETTKLFYNVVDLDPTVPAVKGASTLYNYLETSGSALVAYSMLKGAYQGDVDKKFAVKGAETFKGIYENKLAVSGGSIKLKDILVSAGLGGSRDGTAYYYLSEKTDVNEAKGVGPFLMAYNYYLLCK